MRKALIQIELELDEDIINEGKMSNKEIINQLESTYPIIETPDRIVFDSYKIRVIELDGEKIKVKQ